MSEHKKIAIVGSGLIGAQWSMLYAAAGHSVILVDSVPGQTDKCFNLVSQRLKEYQASGCLRGHSTVDQQLQLITCSPWSNNEDEYFRNALSGAYLVQECVPENVDLKKSVFQKLDRLSNESVILSSSSSCLRMSDIAINVEHKSRCLIAHPVNPPYFLPLVEIVPSEDTSTIVIQKVKELLKDIGQEPVVLLKEVDGFAVNRLQYSLINEAWRMVCDGYISAEDVDKVMTCALAPRYCYLGPMGVMQTNADGIADYCQRYASGMVRVGATFGSVPSFSGSQVETVSNQVNAYLPLDKLPEIRSSRDHFIANLMANCQKQ